MSAADETRLDRDFATFDAANPQVWSLFCRFTHEVIRAGRARYSAEAILQRLRWHVDIETRSDDGFKINNNFRARYAKKFMRLYPEYRGFFEERKSHVRP